METLIWTLIYCLAVFLVIRAIIWYGKNEARKAKEELTYNIMYMNIECIMDSWVINEKSYHAIEKFFETMAKLPYKNKEKTRVLHDTFLQKYTDVINEIKASETP